MKLSNKSHFMFLTLAAVASLTMTSIANALPFTEDFSAPITTGAQAPGVWYTDRYAPSSFGSVGGVLEQVISSSDSLANRPAPYNSTFYNTQGRKLDISVPGATQTVSIDLFVGSDWNTQQRSVGLWTTGVDGSNAVSAYPIVAFRSDSVGGITPGFYSYDYTDTGYSIAPVASASYGDWNNLTLSLTVGQGIEYFVNGVSVGTIADTDTTSLSNVILQGYNFGSTYTINWDNLSVGNTVVPEPATFGLLGVAGLAMLKRRRRA